MSVAPVTSENAGNSGISVTGRRSKPVSYCTASSSSSVPPGKDPHRRTCTFSFRFLSEFRLTERARHHPGVMADVHDLTDRFIACRDVRPVLRVMSVLRFHAESGGPEPQCLTGHPAVFEAAPAPWQVHSPWKRTTDLNRNPKAQLVSSECPYPDGFILRALLLFPQLLHSVNLVSMPTRGSLRRMLLALIGAPGLSASARTGDRNTRVLVELLIITQPAYHPLAEQHLP